ncbi:MAG: conjugal transfer protein TraG N-terminal domain-containing protein [Candidatus Sedimenticola sp. (ex Thyasira tokunagai)]
MATGSFLELYLTIFGWLMYDNLWDILADTGLLYLPFLGLFISHVRKPMESMEGMDAASASQNRIEVDIAFMLTVIVLAGAPFFDLAPASLDYTKPCTATTVSGGATGTNYDAEFNAAGLGGAIARVPPWWYAVMAVSSGITAAAVGSIPCSNDYRMTRYKLNTKNIQDPRLKRELQEFATACYMPSRSDYLANKPALPAGISEDDTEWLGSHYFLNTAGKHYNDTAYRAPLVIQGFPYSAARDTEYPATAIPVWGRPYCNEWWTNGTVGLRKKLLDEVEPNFLSQVQTVLPGWLGMNATEAENRTIRRLLDITESGRPNGQTYSGYGQNEGVGSWFGSLYNHGAAVVGTVATQITEYPKMYMVREAVVVVQAVVLMAIYMLLPFVLLFSGFAWDKMILMAVVIFAVKFWTFLWAVAYWLDNNLIEAVQPGWLAVFVHNDTTLSDDIIEFVVMGMYLGLPIIWTTLIGWAGVEVGHAVGNFTGKTTSTAQSAGQRGGQMANKAARKSGQQASKYAAKK